MYPVDTWIPYSSTHPQYLGWWYLVCGHCGPHPLFIPRTLLISFWTIWWLCCILPNSSPVQFLFVPISCYSWWHPLSAHTLWKYAVVVVFHFLLDLRISRLVQHIKITIKKHKFYILIRTLINMDLYFFYIKKFYQ